MSLKRKYLLEQSFQLIMSQVQKQAAKYPTLFEHNPIEVAKQRTQALKTKRDNYLNTQNLLSPEAYDIYLKMKAGKY